ncbi:UNVERIFIED_CONTAM: Dynein heavy chain 2, axonemal [Gekko kuhli]
MIHWTRQIKEVLRAQEAVESRESAGPLEEIEFWRNRCTDLSEISKQLCKQGVRHIESILVLSKSSYVSPFQRLSKQIQDGSEQAQSNLRFLSILKEPFRELSTFRPKDIPEKLPYLISLVRIVWVNSPYYNSRERITALFRKMSNKIIQMCCKDISLDRLFEGYIVSSRQTLHSCIACMSSWKECYLYAAHMHNKAVRRLLAGSSDSPAPRVHSGKGWVLDQTSIFAQVDAFVQRCKDLLEVCDGQQHFARWEDGKQTPPPSFFGQRGPQMARSLLEIEETFQKNLNGLRNVKGGILDVKNTCWHEDFNHFRAGIKDLEVMTQNLISSAFETVKDVERGVEIQDIFHHLSTREAIKRTFDKKTVDIYMLFNRELSLVNKELSKKHPFLPPHMCHYSGLAHWMRGLRRRIDKPLKCLTSAHFIPHIGTGEESFQTYQLLVQAMDEIERKTFHEWTQTLDKDCLKRLDTPLLVLSPEKPGMLDINFDKHVLKLFVEIHYWDRLLFEIPHYVVELYDRREDLRNLRENLLLVTRDYNRIISMLSAEERGLFRERIRYLDRKIQPGLKKLHWSLKGASTVFISECRLHASKVQNIVNEYKAATLAIAQRAQQMSEALLVRITGKKVYNDLEFEEDQKEHRASAQQKLIGIHEECIAIMRQTYEVFKHDGPEVQQHWLNYTMRMDRMMEDALRLNVKWSLMELSRAINGDGKTSPSPLFRVKVILQDYFPVQTAQVEFSPTLVQLASMVNDINAHLISSISVFRRLPEILIRRKPTRDPISLLVERDEDIKKIQAQISGGMQSNATLLQTYLKTWDVYREIWEVNKDAFINRYRHLNPLVSSFDADTARSHPAPEVHILPLEVHILPPEVLILPPEVHILPLEVHILPPEVLILPPEVHILPLEVHILPLEVHILPPEVLILPPEVHILPPKFTSCPSKFTSCPSKFTSCPPKFTSCPPKFTSCPRSSHSAPEVHILPPEVHILPLEVHILPPEVLILPPEVHILPLEVHILPLEVHILPPEVHILPPEVHILPPKFTSCPVEFTSCPPKFTSCPLKFTSCPSKFTSCPSKFTSCPSKFTSCPLKFASCPPKFASCPPKFASCPRSSHPAPWSSHPAPWSSHPAPRSSHPAPEVHILPRGVHILPHGVHILPPEVHILPPEVHILPPEVHILPPEVLILPPEVHILPLEVHILPLEVHILPLEVHILPPEVRILPPEVHTLPPEVHILPPEVHILPLEVHILPLEVHILPPEVLILPPEVHILLPKFTSCPPKFTSCPLKFASCPLKFTFCPRSSHPAP